MSPAVEYQPVQECNPLLLRDDIDRLRALQAEFNQASGIVAVAGDNLLNRSFNPIFDKRNIEVTQRDHPDQLEKIMQGIRDNIHTNLMERMFAVETYGRFEIRNEQLYSEFFPEASFETILLRGAEWRAAHGSREQEREGILGELAGWQYITDTLVHGPVGTKVISLSPPGIVEKSSYDGSYIDIFEKAKDEGGEYVKRLRIAVAFNYSQYEQTATSLKKDYFEDQDDRPLDAWYVSHPIDITGMKIEDLPLPQTAMGTEEFEDLYREVEHTGLIEHYITLLKADKVDWKEVAKTFNTILTVADKVKNGLSIEQIHEDSMLASVATRRGVDLARQNGGMMVNPAMLVDALGTQRVKKVGGGGCPPNRGFDFVDPVQRLTSSPVQDILQEVFAGSVGQFGFEDKGPDGKGSLDFECDKCGGEHTRPFGGYLFNCPKTGEAYEKC